MRLKVYGVADPAPDDNLTKGRSFFKGTLQEMHLGLHAQSPYAGVGRYE
jgi:hypothetical protein